MVFFGDENEVLDLAGDVAGPGGNHGRGHGGAVLGVVHNAVVSENVGGRGPQFLVRGSGKYAENTAHGGELARGRGAGDVGAVAKAAKTDAGEGFAIRGNGDPVGIPRGGGMAEDTQSGRVEDGDGVDPHFSDVEAASIRGDGHAGGTDAAKLIDQRRGRQALIANDQALTQIKALDSVIVPVRDEERLAGDGKEVRRAAADDFAIVGGGSDEAARLDPAGHLRASGVRDINTPNGKGFRHVRIAQAGDFASLELDTIASFRAGVAVGRNGETAFVKFRVARLAHGGVLEKANIGHEHPRSRDGEGIGITAHGDGADDFATGGINDDETEVRDIGAIEIFAVLAGFDVVGVAVLERATSEVGVQGNIAELLPRGSVEDVNRAAVTPAPVERFSIRRKIRAAAVGALLSATAGNRCDVGNDRVFTLPVCDKLPHPVAGDEESGSVPGHGQSVGRAGDGKVTANRFEIAAVGKNGHAVGVMAGVGVHRWRVKVGQALARGGDFQECSQQSREPETGGQHKVEMVPVVVGSKVPGFESKPFFVGVD